MILARLKSPGPAIPGRRAFTLIELMLVVALMVLLIGMGIRSFTSLGKGLPMREAINEVSDGLNSARQLAISSNANVRFIIITDPNQAFRYSTYGILKNTFLTTSTGSSFQYIQAQPYQSLPAGIYFAADSKSDDASQYMSKGNFADPYPVPLPVLGQSVVYTGYRIIEFTPTGNTLTSGVQNVLNIGKGSTPGNLLSDQISPDKATIAVGSSSGRVKVESR